MPRAARTSAARPRSGRSVLPVVEHLPAGRFPTRTIGPGECARIFTGAPLPEGADTVMRQEDTDHGADVVTIFKDRDVGVNIRRAGEDIRKGRTVLQAGTELGPAQLGVLASLAVAQPAGVPATPGRDPRERRRDRGRGPARGDPQRPQDRQQQHPHAARHGPPRGRGAGESGHRPGHAGEPAGTAHPGARRRPAGDHGRDQRRRARLPAGGAGRARRGAAVLEAPDAAGRAGRVRAAPGQVPWIGLAREPGKHDGDLRALRPAGDPEDGRPPPALPPDRAGARRRADPPQAPAAALSSRRGHRRARWPARRGSPVLKAPAFSPP